MEIDHQLLFSCYDRLDYIGYKGKVFGLWPLEPKYTHSHSNDIINARRHAIKAYRHLLLMTSGLLSALETKGRRCIIPHVKRIKGWHQPRFKVCISTEVAKQS